MPVINDQPTSVGAGAGCPKLSLTDSLSYAAPYLTMTWLGAPIPILQGIYAKYYGFSLTTLATIILLTRLFDAITDPLIGYYSDRYARHTGSRKPFILAGGLLLILSAYFLYVPIGGDIGESNDVSVAYFTFWFMALYLAMTLFEIPHSAWASELALTSTDKAKIFSFRSVASALGMVCFYLVPLLPFFATQDITPESLKVSVISAGVLMLPLLYFCLKNTPNRYSFSPVGSGQQQGSCGNSRNKNSLGLLFRSILGNQPLVIFFCAFSVYGFAAGMWYGLVFLYVDSYLGLGEHFAQVFLLSFLVGIVATPIWCKLAIKLGKKVVLSASMVLLILSYLYASLLTPEYSGFRELLALQILNILGGGCMMTFAPAMLSEIVDYSTLKYRAENTASFYALFMFVGKFTLAVGGGLGLAIAGWYGLDATTTAQTAEGVAGLLIGMAWLPMIFILIGLVLIVLSPIDNRRHGIIRRRLDSRSVSRNANVLAVIENRAMA